MRSKLEERRAGLLKSPGQPPHGKSLRRKRCRMAEQADQNNPEAPVPAASDDTPGAPGAGEPLSLEDRLQLADQKAAEEHEAWLRAVAEMDNVRKRAQSDIASAHKYAVEKLAVALLPVKDSLEATLATATATHDALTSGVELTLRQLEAAFEKFQI